MGKSNYIILTIFLLLMFIPSVDLLAQGPPCCPSPTLPCAGLQPPCVPVPLDGGLSALLLAGVAYGAKRVYSKAK